MRGSMLPSLVVLMALLLSSSWVLQDARSRARDGRPVVVTVLGAEIEEPTVWAAMCLVLFVVVFPMYLVARRAST